MKLFYLLSFFLLLSLQAAQLKIVAKSFEGDEKRGITVFRGNVKITKESDQLNADVVTVYTDAKRKPTKYEAQGKVSFFIEAENNATYRGSAERAIFIPSKKEYHFYTNVHIEQINEKKEINGEEVVVSTVEGRARAKGGDQTPVIMTFEIDEGEEKK
ncbi:lipopolysaccharide transport periplasmic protein LptA [Sulfurimonas sp. HSL3-7]|uniref:lipopolysaccharide transport periplasmic protein LptA n=1 Tax=Sulfonitrofixus jiaomeiensis TaxID=3131938 RepID=UPI0031F7670E